MGFGTSVAEPVTSIQTALCHSRGIACGNISGISSFTAIISPGAVPLVIVTFDNAMVITALALLLRHHIYVPSYRPERIDTLLHQERERSSATPY